MNQRRAAIWAWALYDWGNSAFATTVMAGFFPIVFKEYWCVGAAATQSTARLALANALASLAVMVLAPLLGAATDRSGRRRQAVLVTAATGAAATAGLALVPPGAWLSAAWLFALAMVGFCCSCAVYDALLVDVAQPDQMDRVSSLGYALGYLGGGLLFVANVAMVQWPAWFGLTDAQQALKAAFVSVACWWMLFTWPLLRWVRERPGDGRAWLRHTGAGWLRTWRDLRQSPAALSFLLAYWFYIDGVDTIIRMATDYGLSLGLDRNDLLLALVITQFVGFPAAVGFGRLGQALGARTGVFIGLGAYLAITAYGYFMDSARDFYLLAVAVGLVQGGVQSLSRSLYARLIPPGRAAEFFGCYNMLGKFAAVLGPLLIAAVGSVSGDSRLGLASVAMLFVVGGLLLTRVREPAPGTAT